ncbi:MAG: hypothetical protein PHH93_08535 [Prolixibacteraceae bacterium]|nr:hypothetical protein [Prolixibacteraceae bacterium]
MKKISYYITVLTLIISCGRNEVRTLEPVGYEVFQTISLEAGDLKAVFVDNSEIPPGHRAGYNGITELYHSLQDSSIFVPAIAGFNLEHIFSGDSLVQFFEPRVNPMTLYKKDSKTVLLHQKTTPVSGVETLTEFELVDPHYIDVTFHCIIHDVDYFMHGYAGFFWASYINAPPDRNIYFKGVAEGSEGEGWVSAFSEVHGQESTHLKTDENYETFFAPDFRIVLANNYSGHRYTMPFYYGRFHNMALAFLFDSSEIIRFTQSPTGGGKINPAWDFQYIIPDPEVEKEYSYRARLIYKPFISEKDIEEEYEMWIKSN